MTLINGDCLEKLKNIPDKSIDLLLTDPPFLYVGGGCKGRKTNKKIINELGSFGKTDIYNFLNISKEKLKKINMYVFCSRLQIPYYLNWSIENNFKFDLLIWNKEKKDIKFSMSFCNDIEYIIRIYESGIHLNKIKNGDKLNSSFYCKLQSCKQPKSEHLTPKPEELLEKYILLSTKENDTVLDCFMGSGSTGVAAIKNNRDFIGIEIDKDYFNLAKDRIENAIKQED